jgi:16S rRNA G966 N2-methylase RsmD
MSSLPSLRGFLITGLPLHDDSTMFMTNRQLARLVQEVMSNHLQMKIEDLSEPHEFTAPADSVGINEETQQPPNRRQNSFQIYFDRNIHRRIKHGAFTLVFPSHRVSCLFWMRVISSFPVVKDSCKLENDCAEAQSYRIPSVSLSCRGQITVLDQLQISYSAGKVRDHFYPALGWRQRSALQFDGTAVYSSTNVPTALRQAYSIHLLIRNLCPQEPRSISVLDAFACCGGATLGFLALPPNLCQVDVTAVELDKGRAEMLRHNIELIHSPTNNVRVVVEGRSTNGFNDPQHRVRIHQSCTFEYLVQRYAALEAATVQSAESNHFDAILLDPPWGGPQYNAEQRAPHQQLNNANGQHSWNMDPFPSFEVSGATAISLRNGEIQSESSTVETISFSELVRSLVVGSWSRLGSIIVMKVPACSETWYTALVQECVGDHHCYGHQSRERVFPLAFYFGAHTRLVCFIQNRHFCRGTGIMSNSDLDSLIHDIMTKFHHGSADPSYMGHCSMTISPREHRSRFYDYEKNRWIDLKKWKGSKELNGQ